MIESKQTHRGARQRTKSVVAAILCSTMLLGCHWDMWDQRRYEPLEGGEQFGEGESSSRMLVEGTVPYQMAKLDKHYYEGLQNGNYATDLPEDIKLTKELLLRGQERYAIYCFPCHGASGEGNGMITKRGFPPPPSYHVDRLREAEIGYFYDVMTNGFGRMYSYSTRISVDDRWAIAAYIRALQLSQGVTPKTMPDRFDEIKEMALNPPVVDDGHGGGHGDGHGEDAGHGDEGHGDGHDDAGHADDAAGHAETETEEHGDSHEQH